LGWTRGRLLSSFGSNFYTYNSAGIRTSKIIGTAITNYGLVGSTIVSEQTGNTKHYYYHSANGVVGFSRRVGDTTTDYYYRKNLQGDVVALLNASGNVVAKYVYDAWGNHRIYDSANTIIYESDNSSAYTVNANHIGCLNPIRYRSYYFDTETGLYYLQSRYYDPTTGRFLNPDTVDYLDPQSVTGINLYAYCGNDPVNRFDPTGHFGIGLTLLIATGIGLAFGFGVEVAKQAYNGGDWNWDLSTWNWWEIGNASLIGAATGFAYGLGGVAGGIVKGSFQTLTIAGKALTVSQSVGLLLGTAAVTNFAAGVAGYAMHTAGSETESFNILKGISEGIGQTGKGALSFFTAGMYVGSGFWKVGVGAKNTFSSIVGRTAGRFVANYVPNYMFDNLF